MQAIASAPIGPGVSEALAAERRATIQDLRYDVRFIVPGERKEPVRGRVIARFLLAAPHRIVFDFAQPREQVARVAVNGRETTPQLVDGHVIVPASLTKSGANEVEVEFVSGDAALNRDDEFLYTLFVPARAQLAFPCFDQPDLKARYTLALELPDAWHAVANGARPRRCRPGGAAGRTKARALCRDRATANVPVCVCCGEVLRRDRRARRTADAAVPSRDRRSRKWRETGTPSSTCMPVPSSGWKSTRRFLIHSASSTSC